MNKTEEKEMIEKLKYNLARFSCLNKKEREFLEGKECLFLTRGGTWKDHECDNLNDFIYRLPADYEHKKGGRFVERTIRKSNNQWVCHVPNEIVGGGYEPLISILPSVVEFCGMKFEGCDMWSLDTIRIDFGGRQVIPLKARFWIEGDK